MEIPYISVIITAFNRKDYVYQAINSVLNQTLDPSKYELIIVSNFEIPIKIDKKYNCIIILKKTNKERLNLMIYGIKAAKGSILCFLDDDDLYNNDKLEKILNLFSKNIKCGYIHNGFLLIDDQSNKITSKKLINLYRPPRNSYYIPYGKIKKFLRKINNDNGFVNLSAISIRSSIIDKNTLDYFVELPGNMDEFMFYELLHSGFDLLIDNDILSFYRIHKENNSKPKTVAQILYFTKRLLKSTEMLNRLLENTEFSLYGDMKLEYWINKEHLLDENFHVSFKFLLITIIYFFKYGYYPSLALFALYRFLFKKLPISLIRKY